MHERRHMPMLHTPERTMTDIHSAFEEDRQETETRFRLLITGSTEGEDSDAGTI